MSNKPQPPNKFYVYKITNVKTQKIYIGKTSGENPNDRFYNHGKFPYYESTKNDCPKLYNSIRKHGIESFEFEVLFTFDDEGEAYRVEAETIEKLDTIKLGYNTVPGGIGTMSGELNPLYGKGYLIAGEKNGMYGRTGELNPFYGKTHTPEFIAAIKKQHRKLSDQQVREIKQMIFDKVNYNIISEKFNIGNATITRIRTGMRYADIAPEYQFEHYNRKLSDQDTEAILRLWFSNPMIIKGKIQIQAFYDQKINGVYDASKSCVGGLIRGVRAKHLYEKVKKEYDPDYIKQIISQLTNNTKQ